MNHGLGLSPDGKYLFAAATLSDFVAVYSVPELELLETIPVGREPKWLIFNPDGRYCYVTNRESDDVSVIDVATRSEIKRVKVGRYPQRMAAVIVP